MNPHLYSLTGDASQFMELKVKCMFCDEIRVLNVPYAGYQQWLSGYKHIQDALPEVSPEDREMIVSKMCDTCWYDLLPKEED